MSPRLRFPTAAFALFVALSLALPVHTQTNGSALRDLSGHEVDEMQLRSAVASRTLTWLTGTSANNDYMSVGRMANFFGFVALRVSSGQSLTRAHVARDTLAVLDPSQIEVLVTLLQEQAPAHAKAHAARIEINRALDRLLVGEPVEETEFRALGRVYGAAEAELGRVIAQRFGAIAESLTSGQQEQLAAIRATHATGQSDTLLAPRHGVTLVDIDRQELVNLAARFLAWTTGSPELNDFEVVGKPSQHFGFVSLRLASGHSVRRGGVAGEVLDLLTPQQRQMLDAAVQQNADTFPRFLAARADLMRELEVALQGDLIDHAIVHQLGAIVGEIEANMTLAQALAMLNVRSTLSSEQLDELLNMRAMFTIAEPDDAPRDPVDHGRQLFAQCILCHAPSREDAVAPQLTGIIGRKIAADSGYDDYSPALQRFAQSYQSWSPELLDAFLKSPRALVPGTTMGFDGFEMAVDRAALLAYIATLD
ncbi:MAG: hypothetical protein AAF801_03065 [Pseudomonadota bacterium]